MAEGTGSVHLPSCTVPACQSFLEQTVTALRQCNILCVADYEPGGLYQDRFQQAFTDSSCTIIHVCSEILSKVKRVEAVLKTAPSKAWFVQLQPHDHDATLPDFLLDFHITNLCTQTKRDQFIQSLVTKFGGGGSLQTPCTPGLTQQPDSAPVENCSPLQDDFQLLSSVFRSGPEPNLHVNKAFFTLDPAQCTASITNVNKLAQEDIVARDQAYLSQVFLPDLHAKRDIVSLAKLACSRHVQLSLHALHVVSVLLLEQPAYAFDTLHEVEQILNSSIEDKLKNQTESLHRTDFVSAHLDHTEYLATVYLILVITCIRREPSRSNALLKTILRRPHFQTKTSSFSLKDTLKLHIGPQSVPYPEWHKAVKACLTAWSVSGCEQVKEKVNNAVHSASDSAGVQSPRHKVDTWSLELMPPLAVASLVKSLQESRPVFLTFLEKFQPNEPKNKFHRTLQRMITMFIITGFSRFLQLQSEKLSSSDSYQQVCGQSVDRLGKILPKLDRHSQTVCNFHMTSLLFSSNKAVRQHTGSILRLLAFYREQFWELLLLETNQIMWPLLEFSDARGRPDFKASSHQTWTVIQMMFNGHRAQIHVHSPTSTHHMQHNRADNRSDVLPQDQYFRQLAFLKQLKHSNVLQLIAFHDECCPQFYVTEDYLTNALQTVLVNKSRNGHCFSFKRLLSILLEVLKAVQYCHDNSIVHRDLTAENVFITDKNKVKLAGFKHALRLSGKPYVRDFDLAFMATRWSAPESHQSCCFSQASDMWMVGHLIYEVLTHGRLPYADVHRADDKLMPLVISGEKVLCGERCIPRSIQQLIQELTALREVQRNMSAKDVAGRLQQILQSADCSETLCHYFPDVSSNDQAANKHEKGPVLSLLDDYPRITLTASSSDAENVEQEQGGYVNCGPKKGPMHFQEPCPVSFTNEEWTVLSQENLPGITKIIGRPGPNPAGQRVLPFLVAADSLCSLRDAVLGRWLGKDFEAYILCLRQLANHISYLHSRRIVMCDFAPDTIHVTKLSEDNKLMKVWVTSLPRIKVLPEGAAGNALDRHVDLHQPHDGDECRRAAPEVLRHGQYSPASDVYCFSMLVWWVCNAFDRSSTGTVKNPVNLGPLDHIPMNKIYENVAEGLQGPLLHRPDCCPQHVYELLKNCWQPKMHLRPRMTIVRNMLTLDKTEIRVDEDVYAPLQTVVNASDTESVSQCSTTTSFMSANLGNPSEVTETDYDTDDEMYIDLETTATRADPEMYTSSGQEAKVNDATALSRLDQQGNVYKNFPELQRSSAGVASSPLITRQDPGVKGGGVEYSASSVAGKTVAERLSGQRDGGSVYSNTPPPLPLRPPAPLPQSNSPEMAKLKLGEESASSGSDYDFLPSPSDSVASFSQDRSPDEVKPLPPLQPRCLPSTDKTIATARAEGNTQAFRPLPPTPPVQRQDAADLKEPPPLLPFGGPNTVYSAPRSRPEKAEVSTQEISHSDRRSPRERPTNAHSSNGANAVAAEVAEVSVSQEDVRGLTREGKEKPGTPGKGEYQNQQTKPESATPHSAVSAVEEKFSRESAENAEEDFDAARIVFV